MSDQEAAAETEWVDHYEVLQVSASAEPDTIHRVYRMLAQRFHPDNQESGDEERFRAVITAFNVLSDPEQRARHDLELQARKQERWRLVSAGAQGENDFQHEHRVRLMVLEALYTRRRTEPENPGIFWLDVERLTGQPREHLEFTLWYLLQKKLILRSDNSRVTITVEGADYVEQNYRASEQRKRLRESHEER